MVVFYSDLLVKRCEGDCARVGLGLVKVCKSGRLIVCYFLAVSPTWPNSLHEEKSSLLKLVEKLEQTKTVEHANFIYAVIIVEGPLY